MELLSKAEAVLGPRDASKKICQPQFADGGPNIRNAPNLDGAFVELSRHGESYWPTVIYEMAHETVHLLNPIPGNASYLEEGVAVEFSLMAQQSYDISIQEPKMESYLKALLLVRMLPGGSLEAAKRLRQRIGALSDVRGEHLVEMFPQTGRSILHQLAEVFARSTERSELS